jgi:hypothetical protein
MNKILHRQALKLVVLMCLLNSVACITKNKVVVVCTDNVLSNNPIDSAKVNIRVFNKTAENACQIIINPLDGDSTHILKFGNINPENWSNFQQIKNAHNLFSIEMINTSGKLNSSPVDLVGEPLLASGFYTVELYSTATVGQLNYKVIKDK